MKFLYSILIYLRSFIVFFTLSPLIIILILVYPRATYPTLIIFCKIMVYMFGCRIVVRGSFPDNECFVIMANHVSFLDVFVIPAVLKGRFSAVAASKNFNIPIYSTILKLMKVVSINRKDKEQSIRGITEAQNVLKSGHHIVILPEGTRTTTGKLLKFKKGGFHLAKNTGANILPILTKGLFNIKSKNKWLITPGTIEIHILDIIQAQNKEVNELLDETYRVLSENYD